MLKCFSGSLKAYFEFFRLIKSLRILNMLTNLLTKKSNSLIFNNTNKNQMKQYKVKINNQTYDYVEYDNGYFDLIGYKNFNMDLAKTISNQIKSKNIKNNGFLCLENI